MLVRRKTNIGVDPRGKIKTGRKSDKGFPQALDHFNIDPFPELKEWYGEKPAQLFVYFPSHNVADFVTEEYNLYGLHETKIRSCDGETCIHRIKEVLPTRSGENREYGQGEMSDCVCQFLREWVETADPKLSEPIRKKLCKYAFYLKAFVADPKTGKVHNTSCYLFETHSENSGAAVISEIDKIQMLTQGHIAMLPFALSVKMVAGKTNANQKFPIWDLHTVDKTVEQLKARIEKMIEARAQAQAQLTSGTPQLNPGEIKTDG